jgi:Patatin-like phospholipase
MSDRPFDGTRLFNQGFADFNLGNVIALRHIPRILALDGGGVRGLSSLLIVGQLMREVQRIIANSGQATARDKPPLPCEYFDLICGTSTGGLIALMLGRLRMVCKELRGISLLII